MAIIKGVTSKGDAVGRVRTKHATGGKSLTQQQFKGESDVSALVERHRLGSFPQGFRQPMWGDFTSADGLQAAMDLSIDARNKFAQLPARIRRRFDNDPRQLLRFIEKPENLEEAIKLGLVVDTRVKSTDGNVPGENASKEPPPANKEG